MSLKSRRQFLWTCVVGNGGEERRGGAVGEEFLNEILEELSRLGVFLTWPGPKCSFWGEIA